MTDNSTGPKLSNDLSKLLEALSEDYDSSWISDMYSDTPEFQEYVKSLNEPSKKGFAPKIIGKEFIQFNDEKGNPIKVPSEKYVDNLEEKVVRLEEIMRVQSAQISFLNNKFIKLQEQISVLIGRFGAE
jgi:hypothetical protein